MRQLGLSARQRGRRGDGSGGGDESGAEAGDSGGARGLGRRRRSGRGATVRGAAEGARSRAGGSLSATRSRARRGGAAAAGSAAAAARRSAAAAARWRGSGAAGGGVAGGVRLRAAGLGRRNLRGGFFRRRRFAARGRRLSRLAFRAGARGEGGARGVLAREREVEDEVRGDLEPRGGDAAVIAAPGEGGGPGVLGVGGPGLVVQDGDQAPAAAVDAQVQRRSHEAAAAHAEPATGDFESVV